jgi:hypothetical protein
VYPCHPAGGKQKLEADKVFNTATCTREELIARCNELKFSKENIELAIRLFIDKTKQSKIAEEFCVEEHAIAKRKYRMKRELNNY